MAGERKEPKRRSGSKAGRNEGRKLAATFFNNAALAFLLAAVLQPLLALMRDRQSVTSSVAVTIFLLMAIALTFLGVAQMIARRLED